MSIRMRIVQQFEVQHQTEFMDLEKQFAALEAQRPDFPKGRRLKPISGVDPSNTLIWECDFADLDAAHRALSFFAGDAAHETLFISQAPYFKQVRIEFLENLEF